MLNLLIRGATRGDASVTREMTLRSYEQFDNPQLFGTFMKVLREGREKGVITDEVDEKYVLDFIMGMLARVIQMHVHRGMKESLVAQANPLFEMLWRAISRPRP